MYTAMMTVRHSLILPILGLFILFLWADAAISQTRIHEVKEGETIVSIAIAYQMTANELKALNQLTTDHLAIGQKLRVRDIDPVVPQSTVSAAVGVPPEKGAALSRRDSLRRVHQIPFNEEEHVWYYVKKDDSVSEVARKHAMSIEMLRSFNGDWIYTMQLGDSLIVLKPVIEPETMPPVEPPVTVEMPPVPPVQSPPVEEEKAPPVELSPPQVVQADTLQIVTDTTEDEVMIIIDRGRFTGHTVGRNERLASILERYQMEESDFIALNPGLQQRMPRAGEEVLVYEPPKQTAKNPYLSGEMSGDQEGMEVALLYADADKGTLTASGELYNPASLTVGHPSVALGSVLYLMNPANLRGVFVRVNDTTNENGIMLSAAAAKALGVNESGKERLIVTRE